MTKPKTSTSTPLSDREKLFVAEYVLSGKQTEAFIKAGYSEKSASSNAVRMMEKESVRAAIVRERSMIRQRHTKTADDLVAEYTRLGFTGMSRFMRIGDDGTPVIDLSGCTAADLDLLAEVTVESYQEGSGEGPRRIKRIKISKRIRRINSQRTISRRKRTNRSNSRRRIQRTSKSRIRRISPASPRNPRNRNSRRRKRCRPTP